MTAIEIGKNGQVAEQNRLAMMMKLADNATSANTRKLHDKSWHYFTAFLASEGKSIRSESPELLASLFITHLSELGRKPNTIASYLNGLKAGYKHRNIDLDLRHRNLKAIMTGIRRTGASAKGKDALTANAVKLMVAQTENVRDRAIILLGFATACRRSELSALNVEEISFVAEGMTIRIRKSKIDQTGEGRIIDVPLIANREHCAVRAIRDLLSAWNVSEGPLFRSFKRGGYASDKRLSGESIRQITKRLAKQAGIESDIGAHSLRVGHITEAVRNGVSEIVISRQSGHQSIRMLKRYTRLVSEFKRNSVHGLGL